MVLPHWLQLQLQHLLPLCGQRHCCDNPQVPLLCSSSAGVGLEMQVCYLSAASLPVPSPEPPELAAGVSVDISSHPSVPALGVLPSPSSVSFHPCPRCPCPAPWGELVALCRAWPALGWVFQGWSDGVLADGLCRGEVAVCAPPVSPCCVWSCTL